MVSIVYRPPAEQMLSQGISDLVSSWKRQTLEKNWRSQVLKTTMLCWELEVISRLRFKTRSLNLQTWMPITNEASKVDFVKSINELPKAQITSATIGMWWWIQFLRLTAQQTQLKRKLLNVALRLKSGTMKSWKRWKTMTWCRSSEAHKGLTNFSDWPREWQGLRRLVRLSIMWFRLRFHHSWQMCK